MGQIFVAFSEYLNFKCRIREIQDFFFFKFKGSWFDNPRATSYLPNDDYAAAQQELQEDALYTIPGYIPEYGSTACRVSWFFDNDFKWFQMIDSNFVQLKVLG